MNAVQALSAMLLAASVVACGGGGGGGGVGAPPVPPPPSATELQYARRVVDLVNQERTSRGIDPVAEDADAAEAAYGHAVDMDVRVFFDHVNPSGEDPGDRLSRAGMFWTTWGENIARGQATPEDVMADWMASAGHRDNILDPAFTRLGVGVHQGPDGPWWVQDFVAP